MIQNWKWNNIKIEGKQKKKNKNQWVLFNACFMNAEILIIISQRSYKIGNQWDIFVKNQNVTKPKWGTSR